MTELLNGVWQASLWLAVGAVLLAVMRPLLVRLGGAGLAYRSWWLLPMLLLALMLPLPQVALLQQVPTLPLKCCPVPLMARPASPCHGPGCCWHSGPWARASACCATCARSVDSNGAWVH